LIVLHPPEKRQEEQYTRERINAFRGLCGSLGHTLEIGEAELKVWYFLVATVTHPVSLGIKGEELITTSDPFRELKVPSGRIVLVGGGYTAARAGSKINVLQRTGGNAATVDSDLVRWLMHKLKELGVDVRTATNVTGIDKTADAQLVQLETVQSL
jgi:glutathione reductase (NADPH)